MLDNPIVPDTEMQALVSWYELQQGIEPAPDDDEPTDKLAPVSPTVDGGAVSALIHALDEAQQQNRELQRDNAYLRGMLAQVNAIVRNPTLNCADVINDIRALTDWAA